MPISKSQERHCGKIGSRRVFVDLWKDFASLNRCYNPLGLWLIQFDAAFYRYGFFPFLIKPHHTAREKSQIKLPSPFEYRSHMGMDLGVGTRFNSSRLSLFSFSFTARLRELKIASW